MARVDARYAVSSGSFSLAHRATSAFRRLMPDAVAAALARSWLTAVLRPALERDATSPVRIEVSGGPLAGARLLLDLRCEKFYWLGTHERALLRALERDVTEGMTVWDVGAHIGYVALVMSRLTGPRGRVYAFEPLPENLRRLRMNVAANGADNVDVHGVALSDRRGIARMARRASTLMASLAQAADETDEFLAPTDTVDGLVARGLQEPHVLKVDVEGAEALVLRGARETIAAARPLLALEIHSAQAGREAVDALPVPYRFFDARRRSRVEPPLGPGRYIARAEGAKGRT